MTRKAVDYFPRDCTVCGESFVAGRDGRVLHCEACKAKKRHDRYVERKEEILRMSRERESQPARVTLPQPKEVKRP